MIRNYEEAVAHQARHGFRPPKSPASASGEQSATTSGAAPAAQGEATAQRGVGGKLRLSRQPNKTEAEFGLMLEARRRAGEFKSVEFEAVSLRVGSGAKYTPDYFCEVEVTLKTLDRRPVIFEVKGKKKWDDAIAKFKSAVDRYGRVFRFEMWGKIDGEWRRLA